MNTSRVIEIRIPLHLRRRLEDAAAPRGARESVVFGLVRHGRTRDRDLLLVTELLELPESAYIPTRAHGAKWRGGAMIPVLNGALATNQGIVMFHTHGPVGRAGLSGDDRTSATQLFPTFQTVLPAVPHGSVVFTDTCAAGIVLFPESEDLHEGVTLRWLGKHIRDFSAEVPRAAEADEIYTSQALLTGGAGERALRRAKVAVVGLSGGGSHVVQQLAHIGIGEIIGIDADYAEPHHRSRMIGLGPVAAWLRWRKTRVMAQLVRRINRDVVFTAVRHEVPEQPAIEAIKRAGIVVSCVDNYHARADLQELAWRYMVPFVDIGLLIRPLGDTGEIVIGGNVATFIPGGFCAWCIGLLTQERLDAETGGRPKSYFKGADKQAQVVSMNGVLASQAVSEVLQLVTGFAGDDDEMTIKKYDGIEGTLEKWKVKKSDACERCRVNLGAGDPVWFPA